MSEIDQSREAFMASLRARQNAAQKPRSRQNRHNTINHERYAQQLRDEAARNRKVLSTQMKDRAEVIQKRLLEWQRDLPPRWQDACLDVITDENARKVLQDRIARHVQRKGIRQTSILSYGQMGRGKTYLGYAYIYELIKHGVLLPSQVFTASEEHLASISRSGFRRTDMWEATLDPKYKFFLIDDLGRSTFTDETQRRSIWHEFVDNIYATERTLFLTTNMSLDNLPAWVGNSSFDRLQHIIGKSGLVEMNGEDYRSIIARRNEEEIKRDK